VISSVSDSIAGLLGTVHTVPKWRFGSLASPPILGTR
jgi:hypothetical protein